MLKALESPGSSASPMELVETLRRWARWLKRAQDLGLQVPDPSILLRGLDQAAKTQLERHGEVSFRANMLRYSLELDASPTLTSIVKFQSHLLAEFEQIAYRGRTKGSSGTTPTLKAVGAAGADGGGSGSPKGPTSPSAATGSKPCKFFLMDSGCQRAGCKFSHEWSNVPKEERAERCKGCGAKGHMKRNCPMRTANSNEASRPEGGRYAPQAKVKNVKGGDNKRDDGTVPTVTPQAASSSTTSNGGGAAASMSSSLDSNNSVPAESTTSGGDVNDFLKNATQVLKMMAEQQSTTQPPPSLRMLKKAIMKFEGKMALVDSGATHPLRKAQFNEWHSADEVDVVVAGDGVKRMRQNDSGTLLLEPETNQAQTILPLGSLVSILGYELTWTKKKCILRGPDGKELALRITSGCPELSEATALELIAKLEQEKITQLTKATEVTKQAMVRAQGVQMDPMWERSLREYVTTGKFEDGFRALASAPWATDELRVDLAKIICDLPDGEPAAWDLMFQLGFNRRMRKRLMSKDWIVKLCSGKRSPTDKMFKVIESGSTVVLDIDVQRLPQLDVLRAGPGVMMLLLWGAATGRIAAILNGLPRHNALEHTLRAVVLYEVALQGRAAMCRDADVPMDGVAFSLWSSSESEEDESSLAWVFKWFRRWIAENHMDLCHFEQGGFGHPRRRPTTMTTNLDVAELKGVRDAREPAEEERGSWSMWAPVMVRVLVRGLKRWKLRPGWYSRVVKALKAVDRKAWERHLANDHVPYRQDCLHCIHNATGRPHRKCLHRDCYVLSADTLGPVRVAGVKGEKFAVVFTYQFPKQKMVPEDKPIPDDELVGWSLDARKPEEDLGGEGYEDALEYSPDVEPGLEIPHEESDEDLFGDVFEDQPQAKAAKKKEVSDDWWEFREASGVLIRHHVTPRTTLFRPTSWNGCPIPPAKLDYTRVTEVKFVSGGVDTETSDWHGPQSGARALERPWTGRTTFTISTAEVPEDEEQLQRDEEAWEKLIGDLTRPVEMDTVYLVYPVRARRGGDVMLAVQEAVLRLKLLGLPVARLHSDRGSEFASKGLRKWLLDHDIYHTRSEALVPQTNGAAERGVRWFKTMAKVLMSEAKVGLKYWTLAMQHAANRRMYERLGLSKPKLLQFGSKVMIRRKVFGNNKKYDLTDRWEEGTYLGLSDTIKGGAVVLRQSGVLTETLNLKTNVVDPHVLLAGDEGNNPGSALVEEVPEIVLPEPNFRVGSKQQPPQLMKLGADEPKVPSGWVMRSQINYQEERARYYYNLGKFDVDTCFRVLRDVQWGQKAKRKTRGEHTSSLILGAYAHGGMRGATTATTKRPWLTKYLNKVLQLKTLQTTDRKPCWATLGVFRASDIPPHRDLRNMPGMFNFVSEIGGRDEGGLWLSEAHEVCNGDGTQGSDLQKELPDGTTAKGRVVDIKGKVAVFDPKKLHSYVDAGEEKRWIIAGFTPLGVELMPPAPAAFLKRCGFPLEGTGMEVHDVEDELLEYGSSEEEDASSEESPDEEEIEQRARVLRCGLEEEQDASSSSTGTSRFFEVLQQGFEQCASELERVQNKAGRKILKISPGEAQDVEVEELLRCLNGPLEVVHNVSLPEVRKHVELWKGAIVKEVNALVDSGAVTRLSPEQTRELKRAGLVVLPGKAVFTVKPPTDPDGPEKYRRKCRVVVCGNFLPAQGQNVYASGTLADTLRVAVALAVKMGWCLASTDVANAFTLAPMPMDLMYALTPPTIVVLAGAASPGETWKITRVLYGLREAPRLWGTFRNARLAGARIEYENAVIEFTSTTTDENLWKVTYSGSDTVQGLVLAYVDDFLICAPREIVKAIYKWLTTDWKCTALEWAEGGSLRFLGMELKVCGGGIHLSQSGYVRDLLRQHGIDENTQAGLTVPCNRKWLQDGDSDEDVPIPEEATIKLAQKATGEVLWLSTRSRPELAHAVGCMASHALKKPLRSLEISKRVMKYLSRTIEYGILFQEVEEDPLLTVYSDASFAPGGGRSFGATMAQIYGMPVAWRASKQPVITLSVAEAELYEGCSAVQLGLGISALLSELDLYPVMHLRIDNAAAQGLASEAPGTWKTRHLRIRARFLRQEVAAQRLVISHVCGSLQKADLGTKGFDLPKFKALLDLWQIVPCSAKDAGNAALRALRATNNKGMLLFVVMCVCLVKGVSGEKEALALDGSAEFYLAVVVSVVAAVGIWEFMKMIFNKVLVWWNARNRRQQRAERLRARTRDAVQEEIRRRELELSDTLEPTPTRPMRSSRRMSATSATRSGSSWCATRDAAVQTDTEPTIPLSHVKAFSGPFFLTTYGERVHTRSYCYGQRNASRASKRYEMCAYCQNAHPLYEIEGTSEG